MDCVRTFFIVTIYLCFSGIDGQSDVLKTLSHGGAVRGTHKRVDVDGKAVDVDVFLGIPYAIPPIGPRRFAPPERHTGWSGVKNTTKPPPTCWQYQPTEFELNNAAARMWSNNTEMSEDCLYLNVWAPAQKSPLDGSLLPVMVWIYGGGYTTGTSTLDVYDGTILAATQNVIVVSMQYRLGAFGFLRLDPTVGETASSVRSGLPNAHSIALGNQGLFDQILALEWVHDNIQHFGGSSQEITLFGESSGSVSVSILWLSPLAQRYFKRAILQSGSVLARWALNNLDEAHQRGSEVSHSKGCVVRSWHVMFASKNVKN
ncbi:hypothetical protein P879_08370 [Paragonimus westermani]|uniref:Carboxylic ester hydrolase n=1 Tax=Paragonimus westermani TaxID=34504 RepID=A0A8T0D5B9_9TREM|nr:hypothetical protein P879_08370 [Paragonimus westermani]